MNVEVFLTAQAVEKDQIAGCTAVIIDVLRATSTATRALDLGAAAVHPVVETAAARTLYSQLAQENIPVVLAGERDGLPPPGFELGNSPVALAEYPVEGKHLVLTTSNGTRAAAAAEGAAGRLLACFMNAQAAAHTIMNANRDTVLVCAGTTRGTQFCLEDGIAAGFILRECQQLRPQSLRLSDTAELMLRAACSIPSESAAISSLLHSTKHGRHLTRLGFGADVTACAQLNSTTTVPTCRNGSFSKP